jgi:hypothetical protein
MEDLISSIIDNPAIEAEIVKVETRLSELAATLKSFPKATVFADASGTKDLAAANKQLSVVLSQLKIKNQELTNSIKEQQLVEKKAAAERKAAAAAQKEADREARLAAKQRVADEKEAAAAAQIAAAEKLRALKAQAEAEAELAALQKDNGANVGIYDTTGQRGGAKLKSSTTTATEAVFTPGNQQEALLLNLSQTQSLLKENQLAQKSLNEELKNGALTQAEYDQQIVIAKQEELAYKANIQATNAELKARQQLNDSAGGSITAARAQNKLLIQQRDAIPVSNATPEQIEKVKALNAEIDKNNELIDRNNDLLGRQKINIGNYPTALGATFKTLNEELTSVQGKLVQGNFGGKEFDQLTAKQAVLQNALSLTGKTFKTSAAEAGAYKEAAIQIGQVYGKDSSVFKQFAEGVKQGAVNTKALASEVSGVVQKGGGLSKFLTSAYNGLRKIAYVIPGLGIGGLVLLLLGPLQAAGSAIVRTVKASLSGLNEISKEAQKKLELYKAAVESVNEEYIKSSVPVISKLELLRKVITDTTKTEKERLLALHDYNKIADKNNQLDAKELDNLNKINDTISKQIYLVGQRALANANEKILEDKAIKLQLAEEKAKADAERQQQAEDARTLTTVQGAKTNAYFRTLEREGAIRQKIAKNEAVKQAQAEFDAQKQVNAEFLLKNGYIGDAPDANKNTKNGFDKIESLADQYRKKALKAQQEFIKAQNEAELKGYKTIADDELASLTDRLDAEKKYYTKSVEITNQAIKDQQDAVNLEADLAEKRASKIKDPKKRADAEAAIEDYRIKELKKIKEVGNAELLKDDEAYYSATVQISTQAFDKIQKLAEENAKFIQEQQKIAFQNQKDTIGISKDEKLLQLEKDFNAGRIKNLEEYNQRKQDIETSADIQQKQLDLKRLQDAEKIFEALYGIQNLNLIRQAKDLEVEIEQEGNKKILDSTKDLVQKEKDFAKNLADFIESGLLAANQNQVDKLDAQSKAIDEKSQKEIDAINASTLAEADKQKRITAIEKQAAFEHEQIQKKQDKLDKDRKRIQRLAAVAEVGAEIAQQVFALTAKAAAARAEAFLLLANPLTAALAPAAFAASAAITGQIPFVLASGGLALIKAAAFKDGTDNAPRGKAIVGEEGSELIVDKTGKMYVTPPQPTLVDLAGGEKILTADRTKDFLAHYNLLNILQKVQSAKQPAKIDGFNEKIYRELRSLNGKPPFVIQVQNGMETTDYYMRNIKN